MTDPSGSMPRPPGQPENGRRRRRRVLALLALLLALDWARPPQHQLSARALVGAVHLYQVAVSPWLSTAGVRCRFTPSCSHYAEAAIRRHGAPLGSLRALWRIARCGPWTPAGTHDPP